MSRGGYAKWYDSAYDGTLRTDSPWQSLAIFPHLLAMATPEGILDMTPEAIAVRTGFPLDLIRAGITGLEAPDPRSRTKRENGERLCRLVRNRDWGWRIVNMREYRDKKASKEKHAEYMRKWRRDQKLARSKKSDDRESSRDASVNERDTSSKQYAVSSRQVVQKRGARARTNPRLASPTGNGQVNRNGNHAGIAALVLAKIRATAERATAGYGQTVENIPRGAVESLGPAVTLAYDAIGGATRVLTTPPEKWGLMAQDMAGALEAAGYDFASVADVSRETNRETSAGNTGNAGTGGNPGD